MTAHKDKTLSGPTFLDGNTFENIAFDKAQLIYSGGQPPIFTNCSFNEASFDFRGPAHNTLNFLRSLAPEETRMRVVLEGLIPELKA
jgi:hypothetical protein